MGSITGKEPIVPRQGFEPYIKPLNRTAEFVLLGLKLPGPQSLSRFLGVQIKHTHDMKKST